MGATARLRCCFGSKFKKGQTETVTLCRRPCKRCRRRRRRELRPPPSRSLVSTLHTHSPAPPAPPHLKAQHPSLLKLDPPRGTNGLVVRRGDWLRTASHPSPARRGKGPLRGRRRRVIQMDGRLGRASLSAAPRGTPWSDAPAGPWTPSSFAPGHVCVLFLDAAMLPAVDAETICNHQCLAVSTPMALISGRFRQSDARYAGRLS